MYINSRIITVVQLIFPASPPLVSGQEEAGNVLFSGLQNEVLHILYTVLSVAAVNDGKDSQWWSSLTGFWTLFTHRINLFHIQHFESKQSPNNWASSFIFTNQGLLFHGFHHAFVLDAAACRLSAAIGLAASVRWVKRGREAGPGEVMQEIDREERRRTGILISNIAIKDYRIFWTNKRT